MKFEKNSIIGNNEFSFIVISSLTASAWENYANFSRRKAANVESDVSLMFVPFASDFHKVIILVYFYHLTWQLY